MNYESLLLTISEIIQNDKITKTGLCLTYSLNESEHRKLNEELLVNSNRELLDFTDIFEVEIDGLLVKFIKNENK